MTVTAHIGIAPSLRGYITPRDLISSEGTLQFIISAEELKEAQGIIFQIRYNNYSLECGFATGTLYIQRNTQRLELSVESNTLIKDNIYLYSAIWTPTELKLLIQDDGYDQAIENGIDPISEVQKRIKILSTIPTVPPFSLTEWARKENIAPKITYNSKEDFYEKVANSVILLQDKIIETNLYKAFWDIQYDGGRIVSKTPKRETDIHSIIWALLYDVALSNNIDISYDHVIGAGKLDFLLIGHTTSGESIKVCLEFKHAHSQDLEHGLLSQLPSYMRNLGCDFGIYCVTFFKGGEFYEPKEYDLHGIDFYLKGLVLQYGLFNIRIIVIDLSKPKIPSKG